MKREEGFRDYLYGHDFLGKIYPVHIHADESVENKEILDSFFATHEEIKAGIIFNSRAHVLGDYFQHQDIDKHFKLIGYDVIESNLSHLIHHPSDRPTSGSAGIQLRPRFIPSSGIKRKSRTNQLYAY